MFDSLQYALRETQRRKTRTVGVVLGYLAATAATVLALMSIRSTRDTAVETLWSIGAHSMAFVPRCCFLPEDGHATLRFAVNNMPSELLADDVVEKLRRSPAVADASPYLLVTIWMDDDMDECTVGGFDPSRPKAFSATMAAPSQTVEGVFLGSGGAGGIMVEQEFAAARGLGVGSDVRLGSSSYKIVAIVAPPLRPGKANIYMDIAELRKLASGMTRIDVSNSVNAVLVESKGSRFHREALADIRDALGEEGQITSYGCSKPGSLAMQIHERSSVLLTLCAVVGLLALLLRSQGAYVSERRREIGVLRAVGWSRRDIAMQILSAAMLQSVVGAAIGCFLGLAASRVAAVQGLIGMPVAPPLLPSLAATGCVFGLAVFTGLVAGLFPAWLAARLRPAEVLRQP